MGTRFTMVAPQQPGAGEQIREQVRRDVEQALREARQGQPNADEATRAALERATARLEAEARRLGIETEGGNPRVSVSVRPMPPIPPLPPGVPRGTGIRRGPDGDMVITSGTGQPAPFPVEIPQQLVDVAMAFFFTVAAIFIGTPLARAFARRMDRKTVAPAAAAGPDVVPRLDRIEQAVDAIALEVERISEGQRYVTRLMSEPRAIASPNEAAVGEMDAIERGLAQRAPAAAERGT